MSCSFIIKIDKKFVFKIIMILNFKNNQWQNTLPTILSKMFSYFWKHALEIYKLEICSLENSKEIIIR